MSLRAPGKSSRSDGEGKNQARVKTMANDVANQAAVTRMTNKALLRRSSSAKLRMKEAIPTHRATRIARLAALAACCNTIPRGSLTDRA